MGGGRRWARWSAVAGAVGVALLPILPSEAATADVEIDDVRFSPGELRIDVGDKVQWTNRGDEDHSVVADDSSFESGRVEPGETYERRFGQAGTFPYHCERHPRMTGVIRAGETTTTTAPPTTATPTTASPTTTSSTMAPSTTTSVPPAPVPTTTTPPTTTAPSETAPAPTTTAAPATSATSAAPAGPGPTSPAPTTTTTAATTTTTATTATTTSGAVPREIPPVAHMAGKATTEPTPASEEHARSAEAEHTGGGGDTGEPNRLAVAAFVAVFVPVATGIVAGARRLLRGRG